MSLAGRCYFADIRIADAPICVLLRSAAGH
jgi:hypothetical protein